MSATRTVYVVDDEASVLSSTQWLLEAEGLEVETFQSAKEFMDRYDPTQPGCVVLDICMPDMDGMELQERLVQGEKCPAIVFLTGHGEVSHCVTALKRGAIDFLEKPAEAGRLLHAIRRALLVDEQTRREQLSEPEITDRIGTLTTRAKEVLRLLYDGLSQKQIAHELGVSFQTVAKHRTRVLDKLDVENEAALVRLLLGHGIEPN